MKSAFTNDVIDRPILGYYRNALWEMDVDPTDVQTWCELRLVSRQYLEIRKHVQSITTFVELEKWLNERQFDVYAAPLNIIDSRRYVTPYIRAHIDSVDRKQIDHTFNHDVMLEEQFSGKGWEVEIWFTVNQGRFDQLGLKMALAAYGIYVFSMSYSQDKAGKPCYKASAYVLRRDFKMTDANLSRFKDDLDFDPEDDDEDDEEISESEERARMFEDGFLDQEIEGIHYGDR